MPWAMGPAGTSRGRPSLIPGGENTHRLWREERNMLVDFAAPCRAQRDCWAPGGSPEQPGCRGGRGPGRGPCGAPVGLQHRGGPRLPRPHTHTQAGGRAGRGGLSVCRRVGSFGGLLGGAHGTLKGGRGGGWPWSEPASHRNLAHGPQDRGRTPRQRAQLGGPFSWETLPPQSAVSPQDPVTLSLTLAGPPAGPARRTRPRTPDQMVPLSLCAHFGPAWAGGRGEFCTLCK